MNFGIDSVLERSGGAGKPVLGADLLRGIKREWNAKGAPVKKPAEKFERSTVMRRAQTGKVVLSVEHIGKVFDSKRVLHDVSFSIKAGTIFGLLGPNGAGKSTLIKILTGLLESNGGTFSFSGKKFFGNKADLAKHLGVVPQEEMFYRKFSVEENLVFFGELYGLSGAKLKNRVAYLIRWLQLEKFRKREARELSGGYRRLLNIACSVVHDPELIFLDEPTVALDPKIRSMFWERIKEIRRSGKSVLLTTHYMDEAEELCNEIAILVQGKVLVKGKPAQLVREYGGMSSLVLSLQRELDDSMMTAIRRAIPNSVVRQRENELFIAMGEGDPIRYAYSVSESLRRAGFEVTSSILREPTLEDVFLNLVGKAEGVRHAQATQAGVERD